MGYNSYYDIDGTTTNPDPGLVEWDGVVRVYDDYDYNYDHDCNYNYDHICNHVL